MIPNLLFGGDNCIRYIIEAAEEQDVAVSVQYRDIGFYLQGHNLNTKSGIYIMNTGEIVRNHFDWSGVHNSLYRNNIF